MLTVNEIAYGLSKISFRYYGWLIENGLENSRAAFNEFTRIHEIPASANMTNGFYDGVIVEIAARAERLLHLSQYDFSD